MRCRTLGPVRVSLTVAAATILGTGTTFATSTAATRSDGEASATYFDAGAVPGSGEGRTIGYLSLDESIILVQEITRGIREQAEVAGARLVVCDTQLSVDEALACGEQLREAGVEGVLNFQLYEDAAPDICASYGGLPTVAIEFHQPDCERVFVGRDNQRAGEVLGIAVAEHLEADTGCADTTIVLLVPTGTEVVTDVLADGAVDGYAMVCGAPSADDVLRLHPDTDNGDSALTTMTDGLADIPSGGIVVVFAPNDDQAIGARTAFEAAGRGEEVRLAAHGVDGYARQDIACDPRWIADTGYWPEREGRILVPAMLDLIAGRPVPADLRIPHAAITADDIREHYPDTPACA